MDKIKNLSIRKTIILYMAAAIAIGFFLGAFAMRIAKKGQQRIWWKYTDQDFMIELQQDPDTMGFIKEVPRPDSYEMTDKDYHLSEFYDFLQTYSILLLSVAGMIIAVFLFYRNKISLPLTELNKASEKIAANELDFHVHAFHSDELGTLCSQFETMRQALYDNNQHMWDMVEEQKILRAAIAHDIRSPLTVLRGYQETMLEFVPKDCFDKSALIEMLQDGMDQIDRLNQFVESMRKLSSLEERKVNRQAVPLCELKKRLDQLICVHENESNISAEIHYHFHTEQAGIDLDMIMETIENLLANAFSYAQNRIRIDVWEDGTELVFAVQDDGCGFSEGTELVTKARYHTSSSDNLEHFGLGMYISRLYCEKHGGRLFTGNSEHGGAVVKAVFAMAVNT